MHGDEGWRMKKQDGNKIKWRTQKASKIKGKKAILINATVQCTQMVKRVRARKGVEGGRGGGRKWK